MNLFQAVRETIERHGLLEPGDSLVVGVSGGADSLCLLHLLVRLQPEFDLSLHVAHLNHQLRGEQAAADAGFVRRTAVEWGVPVTVSSTDVAALACERGVGVEEAARQARYAFLARLAGDTGARAVAVGHNAGDQVETVLMHLLRGAGPAGLRGMSPRLALAGLAPDLPSGAHVTLIRPLLEAPRLAIEAYCGEHRLQPRFDHSNLDTTLFRNRLRHEVLPVLEAVVPGLGGRLRQLAELVTADHALLERLLDEKWNELAISESERAITLDLAAWGALPLSLRRLALRRAVHLLRPRLRDLGFGHVEDARLVAERGQTGAEATLPGRLRLLISYDRVLVVDKGYTPPPPPDWPMLGGDAPVPLVIAGRRSTVSLPCTRWQVQTRLLPADRERRTMALANQDRWRAFLDGDAVGPALALRPRRAGERFQPLGMGGSSCSVADFMINQRIPAAWRDRVPILARPEHLLWITGWRPDERARITGQTRRILEVSFVAAPGD